jgi:hypothetical protein
VRGEFLKGQIFETLFEAKVFVEDWRIDYNINCPHRARKYFTSDEFEAIVFNQARARSLVFADQ